MLKKLAKRIGKYRRETILTPIFVTLEVIMDVVIPLIMATLIDKGIDGNNLKIIYIMGIVLTGAALLALLFGTLGGKVAAKASAGFAKNLRKDMYYKVQDYSFSNIDKFSTASIVTRLTTDVTNVQNAFQMLIRGAIRAPLMIIVSLIMAFSINKTLALIFLGIVPVIGLGLAIVSIKAHPYFESVFKKYDKLNNIVQENVKGIRVVKSYVKEDKAIEKFEKSSEEIYKEFSFAEKIVALNSPLMNFAAYSAILLISWFGAKIVIAGNMTTGQLSSLITYAMSILMSLMMLSMILVMIIISRASAERIVEMLDEESDIKNIEKPIQKVEDGSITFENVSFSYVNDENKLCLKDINIDIKSGETIGIIGETGSSKTSLVQLIPRLYDTTKGKVKVGGKDVRTYELEVLRNEVAMVLQKNVLFSGTINENLRWGNENATDEEIIKVCKLAQADEFISGFPDGYNTYIEQGGTNVSGGQKQRLCIARALLKKPKILILDDSTSAVDTQTDKLIRIAFKEEIPNTTKIIIAQRIASVEDADRIIVLEDGKISGIGTHEELLKTNAIYNEIYTSQIKGGKGDE